MVALVAILALVGCAKAVGPPAGSDGGLATDGGITGDGGPTDGGSPLDGGITVDGGSFDGGNGVLGTSILALQNGSVADASCVRVDGIVMSPVFSDEDRKFNSVANKAFYLSEKGLTSTAPRTGIEVAFNNSMTPPTLNPGDDVTVTGYYREAFDLSLIDVSPGCGEVTVVGTGQRPQPAVVSIVEIGQSGGSDGCPPTGTLWNDGPMAEDYEGVLVRVTGGKVSAPRNFFGLFEVSDGTSRLEISPHLGVTVEPQVDDPVTSITGFGHFSFCRRKLRPRGNGDVNIDSAPDCGVAAKADHLLVTEVKLGPTAGEFVEIHNPTDSSIQLDDYYLYNATFGGSTSDGGTSPAQYYYLVTTGQAGGTAFGDFNLRFPVASFISPGAYQVIALTGAANFCATYYPGAACLKPTYEVPPPGGGDVEVRAMRGDWDPDPAVFSTFGFLTSVASSGEDLVLYKWDGSSATVQDADYLIWGDRFSVRTSKTGVPGYQPDTAPAGQEPLPGDPGNSLSFQRVCLNEGGEKTSAGNGITGHDETSENLGSTFFLRQPTPGAPTPGAQP